MSSETTSPAQQDVIHIIAVFCYLLVNAPNSLFGVSHGALKNTFLHSVRAYTVPWMADSGAVPCTKSQPGEEHRRFFSGQRSRRASLRAPSRVTTETAVKGSAIETVETKEKARREAREVATISAARVATPTRSRMVIMVGGQSAVSAAAMYTRAV